jgi:Domain of unknown function (DUF1835)
MLHVLNGDATAAVFARAGLDGERLVWRDILAEGPVAAEADTPGRLDARAAYLAERLAIDREAYVRAAREQAEGLAAARRHDEVVLWFEQDLFCAVNLWRLLEGFAVDAPAPRLSLVYPSTDERTGLGVLEPAALAALFAARSVVTDATLALGRAAWAAYASADPLDSASLVEREDAALPFVRGAFRCHLGRYPSLANGLNELETATLAALRRGPRDFGELFREVRRHPRVRRHGLGDVQFAACVRGLDPLVRLIGGDVMHAEVEITQLGRDVVAGDVDWLSVRPIDTWLGGVHLVEGRPLWRWDGARGRLVPSPAA